MRTLPHRPRLPRRCALAAVALVAGCFADQARPSTFRNTCDSTQDCGADQACIRGLCELPCTQANSAEVCAFDDGYVACINGACASVCQLPADGDADPCPSPQTCVDLGIDVSGGSSNPFGGGGSTEPTGLCTSSCQGGDCPQGETCLQGFCVATCTTSDTCAQGLVCLGGLCIPDLGGSSGGTGAGSGGSATGTGGSAT